MEPAEHTRFARSVRPPSAQCSTWWACKPCLRSQPGNRHERSRRSRTVRQGRRDHAPPPPVVHSAVAAPVRLHQFPVAREAPSGLRRDGRAALEYDNSPARSASPEAVHRAPARRRAGRPARAGRRSAPSRPARPPGARPAVAATGRRPPGAGPPRPRRAPISAAPSSADSRPLIRSDPSASQDQSRYRRSCAALATSASADGANRSPRTARSSCAAVERRASSISHASPRSSPRASAPAACCTRSRRPRTPCG